MFGKAARVEGNSLLEKLPAEQRHRIVDQSERIALDAGYVISDPEREIESVFFPLSTVLSVLSVMTDRSAVETAVIGNDGVAPLAAFHGAERSAEQVMVQVPGEALRMPRAAFDGVMAAFPELRRGLHSFAQALFTFAAQTSGCNRKHTVVQRCARWLLSTHDRVPEDEFQLTHLFISQMLGVRRSSVTVAAEALRAAGAIDYSRGKIVVTNRAILEARSCDCYYIIRSTYDRLMRGVSTPSPLERLALSDGNISLTHAGEPTVPDVALEGVLAERDAVIADFERQMRAAEGTNTELRARLAANERNATEVSLALEQLQVVEEQVRVQMEALVELRRIMEAERQRSHSPTRD